MNVTYEIVPACIANRLRSALDFAMHENGNGFFTGENTRLSDVLHTTKQKLIHVMMLSIVFQNNFGPSDLFTYRDFNFLYLNFIVMLDQKALLYFSDMYP